MVAKRLRSMVEEHTAVGITLFMAGSFGVALNLTIGGELP